MSSPAAELTPAKPTSRISEFVSELGWYGALDTAVLFSAAAAILLVAQRHEPWLDEAQSWLMARDLGLKQLFVTYLRYEGNPGLWHLILWGAIHIFHVPYSAISWFATLPAIAGIGVLLYLAPFPRIVRYLAAFSYFIIYQYAVIARPYALVPLLTFVAAHLYRSRYKHLFALTACLILLSATTVQAVFIAGGLIAGLAWQAWKEWGTLEHGTRRRLWVCAACYAGWMLFTAAILWPPKDIIVGGMMISSDPKHHADLIGKLVFGVTAAMPMPTFASYIPSAVLALLRVPQLISGPFAVDMLLLTAVGAACYYRKALVPFLIAIPPMFAFYAFLYGSPHHEGLATTALLGMLWIAAPEGRLQGEAPNMARWYIIAVVLFAFSFLAQADSGITAMRHEYGGVYCGASDAAAYLKSAGADREVVYAYDPVTSYHNIPGWIAIQPYFDHNIIANFGPPGGFTFDRHSVTTSQTRGVEYDAIEKDRPAFVVISTTIPPERLLMLGMRRKMESLGYGVAHISQGEMFFRKTIVQDASLVIFRRLR